MAHYTNSDLPVNSTQNKTSFSLFAYRVYTKIYRDHTEGNRVWTKISGFFSVFIPCLHESRTVTTRKASVSARKSNRVWTTVHRVNTKIKPCLNESHNRLSTVGLLISDYFFGRMYVSNPFIINFLLTTTYSDKSFFQNRVCTKGIVYGI